MKITRRLLLIICSFFYFASGFSVKDKNVKFYLYTRQKHDRILVNDKNMKHFDPSKPTMFIVHGFLSSANAGWVVKMAKSFLKKENCNVIAVDWSKLSRQILYFKAAKDTKGAANHVGDFIINIFSSNPEEMEKNVHMIGHSLGAHLSGYAGNYVFENTGKKISRISGLDPAGPLFWMALTNTTKGLNKGDAHFVDVIHTSLVEGLLWPIGDVNFYPNGGREQPQCKRQKLSCSHSISHEYFTKSVLSPDYFISTRCSYWMNFLSGKCDGNPTAFMGEGVSRNVSGRFYLQTNFTFPKHHLLF